jgi:hypothetical protein
MGFQNTCILLCQYDEDWTRKVQENVGNSCDYDAIWKVKIDQDDVVGGQVLSDLRLLIKQNYTSINGQVFDWIPFVQEACETTNYYDHLGFADPYSFCSSVSCEIIDTKDPTLWRVVAHYKQVDESGSPLIWTRPLPDDPLRWPPVRWVEFIEDQSVVEVAHCIGTLDQTGDVTEPRGWFHDLSQLERGMGAFSQNEPKPIVNAAGQQTIDPQMELDHRIVYNVRINYPSYLYAMALNTALRGTIHAPDDYVSDPIFYQNAEDEFFYKIMGFPHGTWKFLVAEPDQRHFRRSIINDSDSCQDGIYQYCPTTIKFEIKMGKKFLSGDYGYGEYYTGWIRQVLNNGQVCFRKWWDKYGADLGENPEGIKDYIYDPRYGLGADKRPLLFPSVARRPFDTSLDLFDELDNRSPLTQSRQDDIADSTGILEDAETSEPINLHPDGTQITQPTDPPNHIWYLNLTPANYHLITYFHNGIAEPSRPVLPHPAFSGTEDQDDALTLPSYPWGA